MNCIISASRKEMIGSTLYLVGFEDDKLIENCEPCNICKRLIKNAGISRVVTNSNNSTIVLEKPYFDGTRIEIIEEK